MPDEVTLRDYVDSRFAGVQENARLVAELNVIRFQAIDLATSLAATSVDKRLEGMNEFRQQINDLIGRLITRVEVEEKIKTRIASEEAVAVRIQVLEKMSANLQGRFWALSIGLTIVSITIGTVLHFIH